MNEIVLTTVRVAVVVGLGIERQEQAEDSIAAAKSDSAGGMDTERGPTSRLATVNVGVVSSEVVSTTVVVVTLLFQCQS